MKYLLIVLTISVMSCGNQATDTNAQTPSQPASSAPTTTPTSGSPATQTVNQQAPGTQVSGGPRIPVTGMYWRLIELNGKNIEGKTAQEMYLTLDPTSPQFKSHSGCNLVTGEAKRGGTNQMWFINLIPTSGDCKTPDIDLEFQKALAETSFYKVTGKTLVLSKKGQVPVMTFVAKG